jgi:hypothetical protein
MFEVLRNRSKNRKRERKEEKNDEQIGEQRVALNKVESCARNSQK